MTFKDYFSGHAADYATYRPRYPAALFAWLAQQCQRHEHVWDCATGNGQAAIALTEQFQQVTATDGSAAQLRQAHPHPQVKYREAFAESSGLPDNSVDLVTVAQALHWFRLEAFYDEVKRVLRPGGILAIWCYGLPELPSPALDCLLREYYDHVLHDFWTPERHLVEAGYRSLSFPFAELEVPALSMSVTWTLPEFMGYLYTWSATQRFIAAEKTNPLEPMLERFVACWTDGAESELTARSMTWPLSVRAGRYQPNE